MIVLVRDKVILREITDVDSEVVVQWRNAERAKGIFFSDTVLTFETQHEWIKKYEQSPSDLTFIIEYEKKAVGMVALYNIQKDTAEFGRLLIGEADSRGKGIAKEASVIVLDYGFNNIGLQSIYARVFADNEPPLKLYYSIGFKVGHKEFDSENREILHLWINQDNWRNGSEQIHTFKGGRSHIQ